MNCDKTHIMLAHILHNCFAAGKYFYETEIFHFTQLFIQ